MPYCPNIYLELEHLPAFDFLFDAIRGTYRQLAREVVISGSSQFLKITNGVIICNILFTCVFLLWIHLRFIYSAIIERETERLHNIYGKLITDYLFETDRGEITIHRFFNFHLLGINHRSILKHQIISLHKNLAGESAEILRHLYFRLKLHEDSLKRLYSTSWQENIHAIRELTEMNVQEAVEDIGSLTHNEHELVRIEAISGLVELTKLNALNYFDDRKKPMSEWEQLMIMEKLKHFKKEEVPDFGKWLFSENPSVRLFSVKLIMHFEQFDNAGLLIELLKISDKELKKLIIEALGELLIIEALPNLIAIYGSEPADIKVEIINALSKIASVKQLSFFKSLIHSDHYEISLAASRAIKSINNSNLHDLRNNSVKLNHRVLAIIDHALDDRI